MSCTNPRSGRPPATTSGGVPPGAVQAPAPMARSGRATRSMGRRRRDSSPSRTTWSPRWPTRRPGSRRIRVPAFAHSRAGGGARPRRPRPLTRTDSPSSPSTWTRQASIAVRVAAVSAESSGRPTSTARSETAASRSARWVSDLSGGTRTTPRRAGTGSTRTSAIGTQPTGGRAGGPSGGDGAGDAQGGRLGVREPARLEAEGPLTRLPDQGDEPPAAQDPRRGADLDLADARPAGVRAGERRRSLAQEQARVRLAAPDQDEGRRRGRVGGVGLDPRPAGRREAGRDPLRHEQPVAGGELGLVAVPGPAAGADARGHAVAQPEPAAHLPAAHPELGDAGAGQAAEGLAA